MQKVERLPPQRPRERLNVLGKLCRRPQRLQHAEHEPLLRLHDRGRQAVQRAVHADVAPVTAVRPEESRDVRHHRRQGHGEPHRDRILDHLPERRLAHRRDAGGRERRRGGREVVHRLERRGDYGVVGGERVVVVLPVALDARRDELGEHDRAVQLPGDHKAVDQREALLGGRAADLEREGGGAVMRRAEPLGGRERRKHVAVAGAVVARRCERPHGGQPVVGQVRGAGAAQREHGEGGGSERHGRHDAALRRARWDLAEPSTGASELEPHCWIAALPFVCCLVLYIG